MTKQQLEDKLGEIQAQLENHIVAAKEMQSELKETLTELENIDLEELNVVDNPTKGE